MRVMFHSHVFSQCISEAIHAERIQISCRTTHLQFDIRVQCAYDFCNVLQFYSFICLHPMKILSTNNTLTHVQHNMTRKMTTFVSLILREKMKKKKFIEREIRVCMTTKNT